MPLPPWATGCLELPRCSILCNWSPVAIFWKKNCSWYNNGPLHQWTMLNLRNTCSINQPLNLYCPTLVKHTSLVFPDPAHDTTKLLVHLLFKTQCRNTVTLFQWIWSINSSLPQHFYGLIKEHRAKEEISPLTLIIVASKQGWKYKREKKRKSTPVKSKEIMSVVKWKH